ncbi:hypothetical protein GTG28_20770 [Vibrio sp. OCN044]|uniref:Phage baseplate protein n=1 Tax=Vibrio tetraodonis subsp. pristinus TaxID=2695891 RepID=A0A6L8LZV3_9VIBR|nr:hypothetical protein [Vibrio tetraodonis]MYM61638.1 hypothetical protein [Vibrio tetraodonis subsp. pristinus]
MIGVDPDTGRMLKGLSLALSQASRALATPLGTKEKDRNYGSQVPDTLGEPASPHGRMILINRIFRTFRNPNNGLQQLKAKKVTALIVGTGYHTSVKVEYKGSEYEVQV